MAEEKGVLVTETCCEPVPRRELTIVEKHENCLYPCVRIRTPRALGSGTVLFVEEAPDSVGMFDWYVLTNHHVVSNLIKIEKRWDRTLKREVMTDVLGKPQVEVFTFAYRSRTVGASQYQAEIMAYSKEGDLALLRVRAPYEHKFVATLLPRDKVNDLVSFQPVITIGCGLGERPVITGGFLSGFGYEIDNQEFVLTSAPMIFGNSGGATFLAETGQFIGVPSRISVSFGSGPVTHMGYSITVEAVYKFLERQGFEFVYDPEKNSVDCAKERDELLARDKMRRMESHE